MTPPLSTQVDNKMTKSHKTPLEWPSHNMNGPKTAYKRPKHDFGNSPTFLENSRNLEIYKSISGIYNANFVKIFGTPLKRPLVIPF